MRITRRLILLGGASAGLAACSRKPKADPAPAPAKAALAPASLEGVVAGAWRSDADKARDRFRHPIESLKFWGLKPGMTVVEFWPGAGWYTDILAPYLEATRGKFYAAVQQDDQPASAEAVSVYRRKIELNKRIYGEVNFTEFGPTSGPVAPAGSADLVLFLRNIHNWMAGGLVEKAFAAAFAALKSGGVLGIEEHRAKAGSVPDPAASNGYVLEAYVKQIAAEAGFRFDAASEINANPNDDTDHPLGVWTLPPTRRSSEPGKPTPADFDRAAYDAIGESDRMTLRFVKP
jgi:predicted methyltransferase